ncbi:MAG: hypothetical protein A2078_16535 [Nitrospirae bacterium GWC2_57_9]|nr:MAG: hypothetical protein A2078_16535 [Nitrospirae bacterium GWC2_57_9]
MTGPPSVCVCVPTFNSSRTLPATLDTILRQSYTNLSVFIIDNASTDDTVSIAEAYGRRYDKIRIFPFGENVGAEGNFTRCIQLANGDYTAIYHADDLYDRKIIEKQVDFLEQHREAGAVFTGAHFIDEKGSIIGRYRIPRDVFAGNKVTFEFQEVFKSVLKFSNFLICPSAMVRTSVYKDEIRTWDGKKYASSADLDVWFRILQKHKIGIIQEPLMSYRVSAQSFSYHYTRSRTERADLFLVLDDYVARFRKTLLDDSDIRNYELLQVRNAVSRAANLVIQENNKGARKLLLPLLSWKAVASGFASKRSFKIVLTGFFIFTLSYLPLGRTGRDLLLRIRTSKRIQV